MNDAIEPGDNFLRGVDPEKLLKVEITDIDPMLTLQYGAIQSRGDELLAAAVQWAKEHAVPGQGHVIADDAEMTKASDLYAQLQTYASDKGEVEVTRKKVGEMPRLAVAAINAWFGNRRDRLLGAMATIDAAQKRRLNAVRAAEAAERAKIAREAEEHARKLADEARAAAEATPDMIAEAIAAEDQAEEAKAAAAAPMQDLTRTRSSMGVTTSGSETWTYELVDMMALAKAVSAGTVPVNFLMVNDAIARASIRPRNGMRSCAGLNIFPETKINRRSGR